MRLFKILFSVLLALPMISSAAILGKESDSGTQGPAYKDLVAYFNTLPQKYPEIVKVSQYGTTPKGRPLVVIKVAYPQRFTVVRGAKAAILISGSTHGNEFLGIEDKLPEWFAKEGIKDPVLTPYFQSGGAIYFIPIFNPDGYDARQRENSHGIDLNRDFSVRQAKFEGFHEVETKAARDMILGQLQLEQSKLMISMDYHCCIGAALYPWSFKPSPALPAQTLALYQNYATIIKQAFGTDFKVGTTPDILGYNAIGTSKDFYYENLGSMSFTYEGEYGIEKNKLAKHIQMWRGLIQYGQLTRGILR